MFSDPLPPERFNLARYCLADMPGVSLAEDAILAFAGKRLAAYKCPRQITLVHSLPRTANGKLIRKALVQ